MCAAVADFTVAAPTPGKIARDGRLTLELEPTRDVLAGLAAARRDSQTIVGFAAEHGNGALARAREKLDAQGGRRDRLQRRLAAGRRASTRSTTR